MKKPIYRNWWFPVGILVFLIIIAGIVGGPKAPTGDYGSDELETLNEKTETPSNDPPPSIWRIGHFVDDFGEPTKNAFISTSSLIRGSFSNTATANSELDVKFLISSSNDFTFQLYEYASDNPVKAYSTDYYKVLVMDKDGEKYNLRASNYSDRLTFSKSQSLKLHDIFLKGGQIRFVILDEEYSTSEYKFTIDNADGYDKASAELIAEDKN